MLVVLETSFGINFLYVSQLPENSYFATSLMPKKLFNNFRPPVLASKINKQIMLFPAPFLDVIFLMYFILFFNDRFGDPLRNPVGAKMGPKIDNVRQIVEKCMRISGPGAFCSRPAFPELIIITVPFGPTGLNRSFFLCRFAYFLFAAFLCAIFHTTFLSLFS